MRLEQRRRRRRLISLTPLIDVVFLLLIFFMLTTSFAREGAVAVETLRQGAGGGDAVEVVEVAPDGALYLSGRAVSASALAQRLELDAPLLLQPAAETSLESLMAAQAALAAEGFSALTFPIGASIGGGDQP